MTDPAKPDAARHIPERAGDTAPASEPGDAWAGDAWARLKAFTPARIGLGRVGSGLPTAHHLAFQLAHARARDAVHDRLDVATLGADIAARGLPHLALGSAAPDRATYLRRPDLGRRLHPDHRARLEGLAGDPVDLVFIVADGLSARAVHASASELISATLGLIEGELRLAPVIIVEQGRVAIGDEIGEAFRADLAIILLGERPGLSAADSLGAYVTHAPRIGTLDAARNCISNIRPEGLPVPEAARQLADLVIAARRHRATGIALSTRLRDAAISSALP